MAITKSKKIVFIVIFCIFFLALQEILFRIIFPIPEISNFNRINYSPIFFGSSYKAKYLTNASFIWESQPDNKGYLNELNLYGFRDADHKVEKKDGIKRVVFVGDSFCEGFMAPADSNITSTFDRFAYNDFLDVETMNFGIGGTEFAGYFRLIRDVSVIFKPDYVFLMINSNDFPVTKYRKQFLHDMINPIFNNGFIPRIVYVINKYIQDEHVAHLWHTKPFYFFSPVPSPQNPWSSEYKNRKWSKFVSQKIKKAMMSGKFNPFSVNEYKKYEKNLQIPLDISEHLAALRNFSDQHKLKVHICYIPSRSQVSDKYLKYQSEFTDAGDIHSLMGDKYQLHAMMLNYLCDRLGLYFLDLTQILKNSEQNGKQLYWNYDEHLNSFGYQLAGKTIYEWWKNKEGFK
jgi:lysophospholipase L1-like esterase